jgi:hypothetical protein
MESGRDREPVDANHEDVAAEPESLSEDLHDIVRYRKDGDGRLHYTLRPVGSKEGGFEVDDEGLKKYKIKWRPEKL